MAGQSIFGVFGEAATLRALRESFAVIEFTPTGTILDVNPLFERTLGYARDELVGQHHRLFALPGTAGSAAYTAFWAKLAAGTFDTGEYRRIAKDGREVWLQASYTPVRGRGGKIVKIVKVALDITAAHQRAERDACLLAALDRSQAIIEFTLDGTILSANENFLKAMGYTLAEVVGRKHKIFVDPAYAASPEYGEFWKLLGAGEFFSAEYCRNGKGGQKVWLQGSYNPVLNAQGQIVKVVKFAIDLTERMRHVGMVGDAMARLAQGELNQELTTPLMPSLDALRVDFNAAARDLRAALRAIAESNAAASETTGAVSASAEQLAGRTERQAANLEQTVAALSEITSMVANTAESAAQVRVVARNAKADTETSEAVVGEAVQAMARIDDSSAQIGHIIGVIDEIAFQTNLLALNAGVEAARAGDAGRGFAVVATEVRALAQRSADAAKEIKTLISASAQQVAAGVKSVDGARQALERIAAHVGSIAEAVERIAAGAEEQAAGLKEVNSAVSEMDQMTQQNAAMVEETAAAAHSLAQEGAQITTLLSRFQTGTAPKAAAPARRVLTLA